MNHILIIMMGGNYYDSPHLLWGKFKFDERATSDVLHNLAGKIANDDYDIKQILSYCPINSAVPTLSDGRTNHLCENEYIDSMDVPRDWDFNSNSGYVHI